MQKPPGIAEAIDWLAALSLLGVERLDAAAIDRSLGSVLKYAEDQEAVRAAGLEQLVTGAPSSAFEVETVELDLPALAGAFGRRLHAAGLPVTAERSANFAAALRWCARWRAAASTGPRARSSSPTSPSCPPSTPPSPPSSAAAAKAPPRRRPTRRRRRRRPTSATAPTRRRRPRCARRGRPGPAPRPSATPASVPRTSVELEVPTIASEEEVLRRKRFDALEPDELAALQRMMARLQVATPPRRTRRARRDLHGERIDLRRTLRSSLRTGGDPVRLARRRRRVLRRRMVLLCDISGSMEPYARAYLQFLTCAAAGGVSGGPSASRAEAFAFATRLTRLTRALRSRNPERAIQRAAATAPDWASGTRIGEALKTFNDRHGRRGMARGAVVVILSDGWERGDPELVGREMERLSRLAHRIVWVNPRAGAREFEPRAGGMAAALPHCDAFVSGHTLEALDEVIDAIGAERALDAAPETRWEPPQTEEEPWGSATPVRGSSVAMPSGHGPSRGRTTPGWSG